MKTIVIVEPEAVELKALVNLFEQWQKEINIITAQEEKAAIHILAQQHVDLVVCDLSLPATNNFDSFSLLTHTFPYIPCIALSACSPAARSEAMKRGASHCLDKPVDNGELLHHASELLDTGTSGIIQGIPIHSLLQMLESEEKTCTLQITRKDNFGLLFIQNGELIGAETKHFNGEEAAQFILSWQETVVRIRHFNGQRKRQINKPLISIIMEAFQIRSQREKDRQELLFTRQHQLPLRHIAVSGKRLPIDVGARIKLEFPHLDARLDSTMVGMLPNDCLIVTNNKPFADFSEMAGTEKRVIVKYVHKGRVWMFKVSLIKAMTSPSSLFFFEYPGVIHYHELRQNKRTAIFVPCTFHINGEDDVYGNIIDISLKGALFQYVPRANRILPGVDINQEIFLRCLLPGVKEEQKIDGSIRNINIDTTETRIGIEFTSEQTYLNDIICRYVRVLEDPVS